MLFHVLCHIITETQHCCYRDRFDLLMTSEFTDLIYYSIQRKKQGILHNTNMRIQ